jgi:dipeptide/tripeptide permease
MTRMSLFWLQFFEASLMQLNVPTVQVNLDFSSEVDMVHKFQARIALQPIATTLLQIQRSQKGNRMVFLAIEAIFIQEYMNTCLLEKNERYRVSRFNG